MISGFWTVIQIYSPLVTCAVTFWIFIALICEVIYYKIRITHLKRRLVEARKSHSVSLFHKLLMNWLKLYSEFTRKSAAINKFMWLCGIYHLAICRTVDCVTWRINTYNILRFNFFHNWNDKFSCLPLCYCYKSCVSKFYWRFVSLYLCLYILNDARDNSN